MPSLPPEILVIIFQYVATNQPAFSTAASQCLGHRVSTLRLMAGSCARCRIVYMGWITVAHVCRRWRDIALTTPSLWTILSNYTPIRAAEVFLERSGELGLTLLWELDGWSDFEYANATLERILGSAYLRVERLVASTSLISSSQGPFAQFPLRNLQRLKIICDMVSGPDWNPFAGLQPAVLHELTLSMRVQFISWHAAESHVTHLRTLTLDLAGGGQLDTGFLLGLRAMKLLEVLRLHSLSTESVQFDEQQPHGVNLNCREVDLEGEEEVVATTLGVLRLRPDVRLRAHVSLRELGDIPASAQIIVAIREHLDNSRHKIAGAYSGATFEHSAERLQAYMHLLPGFLKSQWRLRVYSNSESILSPGEDSTPDFDVCVRWTTYEMSAQTAFIEHGDFFGLAGAISNDIHELHLISPPDGSIIPTPNVLRHHLKSWTSVERLRVSGTGYTTRAIEELMPRPEQTILFPRLVELAFSGVPAAKWTSAASAEGDSCLGAKLAEVTRTRREADSALRVLEVSGDEALQNETWWSDLHSSGSIATIRVT